MSKQRFGMMPDGAKDEESKYLHLLREPDCDTFHNLADGAIVNVNGNNLRAGYSGGDGNDPILTVVLSKERVQVQEIGNTIGSRHR